ncbi:D-isomer specific 2-hydroxyacid dehydrogenase [Kockiozyma suomiensis]|uniref:D-isomer specific 2-hydroxyacid dehydrogenase n=1 Tax=Kockiozyma suomiensis TaxID=1337062 RepID=UPI0033431FCB
MSKPAVVLFGNILHAYPEWQELSSIATLFEDKSTTAEELRAKFAPGAEYSSVVAIFHTHGAGPGNDVDTAMIDAFPSTLKYICHHGAGYDMIDVHACAAKGIKVSNTPGSVDDATADVNIFLILSALRNFNQALVGLRRGEWNSTTPLAHDPEQKVLGILGMGGIGRALKKRAEAFDMKVIYHNRKQLSEELSAGAEYTTFDELLARSDVISLNLPLNASTRHIIDKNAIAKMKDGVVITNTARGAVIDEAALVEALDSGKVFSAGLDVFEEEPKIHPGLLSNEKVTLLPHIGTHTLESRRKMELQTLKNLKSALTSGLLVDIAPESAHLQK